MTRHHPRLPLLILSPRFRETAIDAGVATLCVLPLLLTAHLPLSDAPNHLARQFILHDLVHSPQLQQYYYVHWALVPNLALEIFMEGAGRIMPLPIAMRLFCIVTVLLLFLGTRQVNLRLSNGTSRAYRVVPLLCWGGPFQYGFLSYCFGIGLGLLLFGLWLEIRMQHVAARVGFLLVSGTALMLCHLGAFGLFAIAVGMCELAGPRRLVRLVAPVASLTAVLVIFVLLSPTAESASGNPIQFSGWHDKARAFAAIIFFSSPKLEVGLLAAALLGLVLALLTRTVRWNKVGAGITAAMTLVWLITPTYALDANFIDYRLPWAISFFAAASLLPGERRWARPAAAWFGVLCATRIALISILWLRWEPTIDSIDQALRKVTPGARIMTVVGEPGPQKGFRDPDLTNVASYAVIRTQSFEPGIFASISGQILQLQPHYRALARADGFPENTLTELNSLEPDYNYVLVLSPELAKVSPRVAEVLVPEAEGPHFKLFRVARSEAGMTARETRSKPQ